MKYIFWIICLVIVAVCLKTDNIYIEPPNMDLKMGGIPKSTRWCTFVSDHTHETQDVGIAVRYILPQEEKLYVPKCPKGWKYFRIDVIRVVSEGRHIMANTGSICEDMVVLHMPQGDSFHVIHHHDLEYNYIVLDVLLMRDQ